MPAADLAFLLVGDNSASNCFPPELLGRVGGLAYFYEAAFPFGLSTAAYAIANLTASHEIGHLLGGDHSDGGTGTANGTTVYAHGMIETTGAWQSMMGAYNPDTLLFIYWIIFGL
ncbi:MAG: hypothetical protein L3J24_04590 [Xanthomonadales bacterium]|nr:hypothetical protein [Xanthomonadales bacterium]